MDCKKWLYLDFHTWPNIEFLVFLDDRKLQVDPSQNSCVQPRPEKETGLNHYLTSCCFMDGFFHKFTFSFGNREIKVSVSSNII